MSLVEVHHVLGTGSVEGLPDSPLPFVRRYNTLAHEAIIFSLGRPLGAVVYEAWTTRLRDASPQHTAWRPEDSRCMFAPGATRSNRSWSYELDATIETARRPSRRNKPRLVKFTRIHYNGSATPPLAPMPCSRSSQVVLSDINRRMKLGKVLILQGT